MNNSAQTLGLAIISSLTALIIGLVIVNLLTPEVDRFRVDMNCASPSDISDGVKLVCLVGDTVVIYWIVLVMSLVIGAITSRLSIS